MVDVVSDAVKLAVHQQTFGWQTAPTVYAQLGTLGLWTPDVGDLTLTAIAASGWSSIGATAEVSGRSVGLVSPGIVWSCDDVLVDTTGLVDTPFDGVVMYDPDTDMFLFFYDLAGSTIPDDTTTIAADASGLAIFGAETVS
jgi:hypothetical protein